MEQFTKQTGSGKIHQIDDGLFRFADTCNVYIIRQGDRGILIDFGSGSVMEVLKKIGIKQIEAVLMTHHHRDQGQGLDKAVKDGIPIFVPHMEQELFTDLEGFWQGRQILNNYNVRQDRFSRLDSIEIAGTLRDYEEISFGSITLLVVPTPGHTPGSISLMTSLDGKRVIFSGDLIHDAGKLWSLSATQWTYNGAEGFPATIASLLDLKERKPDVLLPSHGKPIEKPNRAIEKLVERLWDFLKMREENPRLFELRESPYTAILPHLLRHRASMANAYVLLSESGKAMMIDFGYDFITGIPQGTDRASRRPWLYTLPALKEQFNVTQIDVVIPTHYHDDHVAGMNLLRDVEGAETWVPSNFSSILRHPTDYDLPCLWYDPIPVDRELPLEKPLYWEEYTLEVFALPGHTRYAAAILFEVDGKRVLAVGDQYQGDKGLKWNYVYQNRYRIGDYQETAALYQRLNPELILPGHWQPFFVKPGYFTLIMERAKEMEELQRSLLPDEPDMGAEGFIARITPYQVFIDQGEDFNITVEINNPYQGVQEAAVHLQTPKGWQVKPPVRNITVRKKAETQFKLQPPGEGAARRIRIAADVTISGHPFGEQAEALITITLKK